MELVGILLVVQGIGGLINRLAGASSPSWFVQLHVLPPGLHIWASVLMAGTGGFVLLVERSRKNRA